VLFDRVNTCRFIVEGFLTNLELAAIAMGAVAPV
jgi:hypothetical protein